MLQTIFDLVVTNWKTTTTGIVTVLVWVVGYFGVELSLETRSALTAIILSIGQFFSKDGNKF